MRYGCLFPFSHLEFVEYCFFVFLSCEVHTLSLISLSIDLRVFLLYPLPKKLLFSDGIDLPSRKHIRSLLCQIL